MWGVLILDLNKKPEIKTGKKGNIKALLKNKKFLLVAGGVAVLALLAYFFKGQTSSGGEVEGVVGSYGEGGGGSYGGGVDSYDLPQAPKTSTIIDNGESDTIINIAPALDKTAAQQEASNQIYDLKDLWTNTSKEFGENPTTDQKAILDDIHQKAAAIAKENELGEGGVSGLYPGLKSDTRIFNSITGAVSGNPTQEIMTENIKTSRIEAQNKITDLKKQWNLTADQVTKNKIHQEAEKIGIESGLGVGGADGSGRAVVDTKTGTKSKKVGG